MESSMSARRVQRVRHEVKLRSARVVEVQRPTPGFVRVRVQGEALRDFVSLSFDDHVKLFLQGPGGEPARRDYTPLLVRPDLGELTLEVALHAQGPASDWARQVRVGQSLEIGGPKGSTIVPADLDWHLLAGDETALPAISRRLAELPAGARVLALVQVADPADERPLPTQADVQLRWVRDEAQWLQALRALPLPAGEGYAWCAGEAHTMAAARTVLLEERRLPLDAQRIAAYWRRGEAGFHEHGGPGRPGR